MATIEKKLSKTEYRTEVLSGADIFIEELHRQNTDFIFGHPGGAIMPGYDSLYKNNGRIKHILFAHEQSAVHAASGYSRRHKNKKIGACIATSGPGAMNFATGLGDAKGDSTALVAFTGQVPTYLMGTDAFQETDTIGFSMPLTKHNILVRDVKDLPRKIREAFYIAGTGRPGPVLVDLPKDVLLAKMEYNPNDPVYNIKLPGYRIPKNIDENSIDKAVELIKSARNIMIYTGGGVLSSDSTQELVTLAEKLDSPVTTTLAGLGGFPESHRLSRRWLGMHGSPAANYGVNKADLLIAIGATFDDRVTGKLSEFSPNSKKIHIDIDEVEINKNVRVDAGIIGDAKKTLQILSDILSQKYNDKWHKELDEIESKFPFPKEYDKTSSVIKPQYVIESLYKITNGKAVLTTGVGQHQMWAAQYWKFDNPNYISSLRVATMGYGQPASIGAYYADPESLIINIDGDGSNMMTINAFFTIAQQNLPIKTIIFKNWYLGMVRNWQDLFFGERLSEVDLKILRNGSYYPQFAKGISALFGIDGKTVMQKEDVVPSLEELINYENAYVLEILVDPTENVFPIVPSGAAWHEFIY